MYPALYDLVVYRGAALRFVIQWTDDNETPINLTGYRILFQIRRSPEASSTLLSFDSDSLGTGQSIGPLDASGTISVTIEDEQTALLPAGAFSWDLVAEAPSGSRDPLGIGSVFVRTLSTRTP